MQPFEWPAGQTLSNADLMVIAPALLDGMPELLDELQKLLADVAPSYATFIAEHRDVVMSAAKAGIGSLVSTAEQLLQEDSTSALPDVWTRSVDKSLFEEIGRIQWREGIPIGTLLSVYQLGARVAWRHMSSSALASGLPSSTLAALAESVFAFVDQLSSASAAGYLAEQSEAAAARERSRDELVELLLSDRSDSVEVQAAASRANWPLPATATVVFVESHNEVGRAMVSRLDERCLPLRRGDLIGAIVPDPASPVRAERLRSTLRGSSAVIGHTVSLEQLPASARIAEIAARLQQSSVLAADPVFVDQHLDAIIVHRDPRILDTLARQVLGPLDAAPNGSRDALRETLRSWLRHMGDRHAIAADLQVHPQTVRYRMARLRELFGDQLDDPAFRLKLTLAIGW